MKYGLSFSTADHGTDPGLLVAVGVTPRRAAARRHQMRVLAWAEAGILTIYGLVLAGAGWLAQSGVIAPTASADHHALAWRAYLWGPWFLLWGVLVAAALVRSPPTLRRPDRAQPQPLTPAARAAAWPQPRRQRSWDGEGKEMAWNELIGWMDALVRPTRSSSW